MNSPTTTCSSCQSVIATDAGGGLCPLCVLLDAMGEDHEFTVAGYTVERLLGEGGMGRVYRAVQHSPHRTVALKMLPARHLLAPDLVQRFRNEAETVAALDHPAILPIYSVGEHDGMPYFTMKLAEGGTLAERKSALQGDWPEIASSMAKIASAVEYAHQHGVLHRDLKPANILFDGVDQVYVSDFGLAKLALLEKDAEDLTQSMQFLGTPAYLAPELALRSLKVATTSSDIYALGAMLYELLGGRKPYQAESIPAILQKIINEEPESLLTLDPSIPLDLVAITQKCLEKSPKMRYASTQLLADDLTAFLDGQPVSARIPGAWEKTKRWVRKRPAISGLIAALVAGGILASILQANTNRQLTQALTKAGTERHNAEGLIEYLNGSLSSKLQSVGRLDFMEDVGRRSEAYFISRRQDNELPDRKFAELRSQFFTNRSKVAFLQGKLSEALAAADQVMAEGPSSRIKAEAMYWKAMSLLEAGTMEDGIELLASASKLASSLDATQNKTAAVELQAQILVSLGDVYVTRSMPDEVLSVAEQLESVIQGISKSELAENPQLRLRQAQVHYLKGYAADVRRDADSAQSEFAAYHEGVRAIQERDPDNRIVQQAVMESLNLVGNSLILAKDYPTAKQHYESYQQYAQALYRSDPTNTAWRRELGISHGCLCAVNAYLMQRPQALDHIRQFLEFFQPVVQRHGASVKDLRTYSKMLDWAAPLLWDGQPNESCQQAMREALSAKQRLIEVDGEREEYYQEFSFGVNYFAFNLTDLGAAEEQYANALDFLGNHEGKPVKIEGLASMLARWGSWLQQHERGAESIAPLKQSFQLRQSALAMEPKAPKRAQKLAGVAWWLAAAEILYGENPSQQAVRQSLLTGKDEVRAEVLLTEGVAVIKALQSTGKLPAMIRDVALELATELASASEGAKAAAAELVLLVK